LFDLILVRHGQSEWNKKKLFTGWQDVSLSEQGVIEAQDAGKKILELGLEFDLAYTSMLERAIKTLWIILEESKQVNLPVKKAWQINERHYGALQGKNKDEMREKHGADQVHIWRRSFDTPPPACEREAVRKNYEGLNEMPVGESLKDACERVIPFWENEIKPNVLSGKKLIIAAHGNSLRALVKHLEGIDDTKIVELEIPTGKPIKLTLDKDLKFVSRSYL